MPLDVLREEEFEFLDQAIAISAQARIEDGYTPFGAVVAVGGLVVGVGRSSVVRLRDATAHAEVMALRDAGQHTERAGFEDKEFYRQLALPNEHRTRLVEVQASEGLESRIAAVAVLEAWSSRRTVSRSPTTT